MLRWSCFAISTSVLVWVLFTSVQWLLAHTRQQLLPLDRITATTTSATVGDHGSDGSIHTVISNAETAGSGDGSRDSHPPRPTTESTSSVEGTSVASSVQEVIHVARPLPRATTTATAASIAEAAASRQPFLWKRSVSPARQWRALRSWQTDEALSALVPWVVARSEERGGSEFVLTAPDRGGSMPLLHVAPPWEPLHTPTRNVSVSAVLTGAIPAALQATARRPADLRLPSPSSPPPSQRLYYSGSLSEESTAHWQTRAIVEELSPMDALLLRDASALYPSDSPQPPPSRGGSGASSSALPANRTSLRLWLTSADVLARAHYDKSHNILCVIRGTKRLVLWPPEELPSLHLYPAVHAAHRQSQVSLTRLGPVRTALESANAPGPGAGAGGMEADGNAPLPLGRTAPSLSGVAGEFSLVDPHALLGMRGAWSAEVASGECLYTPPYWAHAVYSPEPSIALAAFSTSWEQARWARSGWLMAPLGRFASGGVCSKARGAALLITAFVHACAPILRGHGSAASFAEDGVSPSPRAFLAHVFAARFAPLYGALHTPTTAATGPSSVALSDCLAAPPDTPDAPELDASLRRRIRAFASSVAGLLINPDPAAPGGPRTYSIGVAAELAADYVEEVSGWACGADGAWRLVRLLALTEETDVAHDEL